MERVQKFLSSSGIASRRKAEEFIRSGQVFINGKKAKLGDKVDPKKDVVKVYGRVIRPDEPKKIYLMLNKPKNYVVTKTDPQGRNTIYKLLPADIRNKVWNVGRLDYKTEGLIILTNDGDLTNKLTHPSFEHEKEYEVTTSKEPSKGKLEKLKKGIKLQTGTTSPAKVIVPPHPSPSPAGGRGKNVGSTIRITLHEGKKHQIRRMFNAVHLDVLNLKRIRIGKLKLPEDLKAGEYRFIQKHSIL